MNLISIIETFEIKGTVNKIFPYGNGHIHSTYKVETVENDAPDYILQLINHTVFKNVNALSDNLERITGHIYSKLKNQILDSDLDRYVLSIIKTRNGKRFHTDVEGNCWRVFIFIKDSKTIEILKTETQAKNMGLVFGGFVNQLNDFPKPPLLQTIADFHNTGKYIDQLKFSSKTDINNRISEIGDEVEYLLRLEDEIRKAIANFERESMPIRNVHQDVKLNNILFDENDKALCIIDLDTVMPGYLYYDFGDAVRSSMNTGKEDEKNLANIGVNMPLFKAFAKAYCHATKSFVTPSELDSLVIGTIVITYEQAVRFAIDFIRGDVYYKTNYRRHNLIRTRVQIAYLIDLKANFNEMDAYVQAKCKGD